MKYRSVLCASAVLISTMVAQMILWEVRPMLDVGWWSHQLETFHEIVPGQVVAGHMETDVATIYPGTTILLVAKVVQWAPVSSEMAIRWSTAIWVSLATMGVALLGRRLRNNLWWFGAALTVGVSHVYREATPGNAVAAALITLLCMMTWFMYEQRSKIRRRDWLWWGCIAGLAGATRADSAALTVIPLLLCLWPVVGLRRMIQSGLVGLIVFMLADPFLWRSPAGQVQDFLHKVDSFYVVTKHALVFDIPIAKYTVVTFMTILFTIGGLGWRRLRPVRLPHPVSLTLIGITIICSSVLLTARYQAIQYFFPMIMLWQVVATYYLFAYVQAYRDAHQVSERRTRLIEASAIVNIVLLQAFLFWI